jgi:hypothetical protein
MEKRWRVCERVCGRIEKKVHGHMGGKIESDAWMVGSNKMDLWGGSNEMHV